MEPRRKGTELLEFRIGSDQQMVAEKLQAAYGIENIIQVMRRQAKISIGD